jgi:ArsR family transcriptional regulator
MKTGTRERYEARAKVVRAMAHPSRLLILDTLAREDRCVGELAEVVGADPSTVSKHLALLRDAGLVGSRKEGTLHYYHVTCGCIDGFFRCIESVLHENLKAQRRAAGGVRG